MKRYISYILTLALLLLLVGSVVMACNNCSSLEWTVLEIHSQEDLAMVLEQANLSEVKEPSVSISNLLNEIGTDRNCTAYLLIPASAQDPCRQLVRWSCRYKNCPKNCNYCFDTLSAWNKDHRLCDGHWRICCPTNSCVRGTDEHGCETLRCAR
jgi:hypothetical protein